MAIAFGATNITALSSSAATFVADLPAGMSTGKMVVLAYEVSDYNKFLTPAVGWSAGYYTNAGGTSGAIGFVYRECDGSEGADETFSYNAGTAQAVGVSFLVSGHDVADPFNTLNTGEDLSDGSSTWDVPADTITGIAGSDSEIILLGGTKAVRTISSQDADLSLIASANSGYSLHVLNETSPGSGNSEYINGMSDTRTFSSLLLEIKAASGSTAVDVSHYYYNMMGK